MGIALSISLGDIGSVQERRSTVIRRGDRSVGSRLQAARVKAGFSQERLASLMNEDRKTISHWETGRRPIGIAEIRRFGELCEASPAWLAFGDEAHPELDPALSRLVSTLKGIPEDRRGAVVRGVEELVEYLRKQGGSA
ncbi:MAG: helix-turn-helix domain-containing protein [Chloroflexota bacterium]|nr:helix-turn-helix domain-containing protein [Chloroflexota bacterium]